MKKLGSENDYLVREAILDLLSDDEVGRVAMWEAGGLLETGSEYVDLARLRAGIRTVDGATSVVAGDMLPRCAVDDLTWTRILAKVGRVVERTSGAR